MQNIGIAIDRVPAVLGAGCHALVRDLDVVLPKARLCTAYTVSAVWLVGLNAHQVVWLARVVVRAEGEVRLPQLKAVLLSFQVAFFDRAHVVRQKVSLCAGLVIKLIRAVVEMRLTVLHDSFLLLAMALLDFARVVNASCLGQLLGRLVFNGSETHDDADLPRCRLRRSLVLDSLTLACEGSLS